MKSEISNINSRNKVKMYIPLKLKIDLKSNKIKQLSSTASIESNYRNAVLRTEIYSSWWTAISSSMAAAWYRSQ